VCHTQKHVYPKKYRERLKPKPHNTICGRMKSPGKYYKSGTTKVTMKSTQSNIDPSAVIMLVVVSLLVGTFIGLMLGLTVGVWT